MEAELNSPMCRLNPGEECQFDTDWFPTRTESDIRGVTDAALLVRPLRATQLDAGKIRLTGSFGVFYVGRLVVHFTMSEALPSARSKSRRLLRQSLSI